MSELEDRIWQAKATASKWLSPEQLEEIARNLVTDRDNWQKLAQQTQEELELTEAALQLSQKAVGELAQGQSDLITLLERVARAAADGQDALCDDDWSKLVIEIRAKLNQVTIVEEGASGGMVVAMAPPTCGECGMPPHAGKCPPPF